MRLFILFFTIVMLFSSVSNAISIPLGEASPDFSLRSLDGESVTLSEHKGSVVVLIYWRTDHKRSLLALKDGRDVMKSLKKKDIKIFSILGGSDDKDKARAVMKDNDIDFPVLVDTDRTMYSDYGIRVYPTTIIINKETVLDKDIPSHPLTYKKLLQGHIKKALGEIDEAGLKEMISSKREKKDKPTLEAERLYNLAMKFTKSGLQDMAVNTVRKSIKVKSDMTASHILLGFLLLDAGETDEALSTFNKAVELDPKSKEAQTGLGGALVLKGDAEKAIEILVPATKANPYSQMTYYELGKAYELKGDKDKSIQMFKKAIEKIIHKAVLPSTVARCQ